jgi:predicted homoserine dehydrogenase-like protein
VYEIALDRRPSLTSEYWTSEVGAESKRPLKAGELITGIGTDTIRGLADPADDFARDNGVPLGVLAGARLTRDVPADQLLTYDDVELDEDALIVRMRRYQDALTRGEAVPSLSELHEAISH